MRHAPALLVVLLAAAGMLHAQDPPEPPSAVAEAPEEQQAEADAQPTGELSSAESATPRYQSKLSAFEPMYAALGWRGGTNAKIQLSFKYRFVNPEGALARSSNWFNFFHFGYTQTSLWDIGSESNPFYDTSYKPSLFFLHDEVGRWSRPGRPIGLQIGVEHESNGQGGDESRSLNIAYAKPIFKLGEIMGARFTVAPKLYFYFGGLSDNPDIADYRGYVDLEVALTHPDGWKFATMLRKGTKSSYGSFQLDVSYPLDQVVTGSFDAFIQFQYFAGWGETLRSYNQKLPAQLRVGIMIIR